MLFSKLGSNNPVIKDFEKNFKNYPESLAIEIDKIILIADYFMHNIEQKMFNELKSSSGVLDLDSKIEDIIYCTVFLGMAYTGFTEGEKARFQMIAGSIIFGRNCNALTQEDVQNLLPLNINDIDKDIRISFFQLMTRIYEKWNKEFTDLEIPKYNKLFDSYNELMIAYISGTLKGLTNISPSEIHNKAKLVRQNYKRSQLMMIEAFVALSMGRK